MKIPQPKPNFLVGNLKDIDPNEMVKSLIKLSREFDDIFKLDLPGGIEIIIVGSQELVNELCDEQRFDKSLGRPLKIVRSLVGDGLFTARTSEPNWGKAHRLLTPAFGPVAIRNMFPQMLDIAEQLMLKLERMGDGHTFEVAEEMTKLTLDTIALCAFDYRFNSFYSDEMHPFVHAMVDFLSESSKRVTRVPFLQPFLQRTNQKYLADQDYMKKIGWEVINARRHEGNNAGKKDLLALMLNEKDPQTGEGLSDENIIYQLITFLIAGHETTSGLLSFAVLNLLQYPETLQKARAEVDTVLSAEAIRPDHLPKLTYLDKVLKETLRLYPTAPGFIVSPYEDTTIGGKYNISKRQIIGISTWWLHRDKKVWGENVESFDPERFSEENFKKLPPNSWKAFGNGRRACIGRAFAMQEATMVMAMLLQRFDISMDNPVYELDLQESLTIKPRDFKIRTFRRGQTILSKPAIPTVPATETKTVEPHQDKKPILFLYGSNSGSAQSFANDMAGDAQRYGFQPTVATMDEYADNLTKDVPIVIITASYDGKPPHNAARFVQWLKQAEADSLPGIRYAVFGCGHTDWVATYQAVPRLVDQLMSRHGGTKIIDRGEANAAGDFFGEFETWAEQFWKNMAAKPTEKKALLSVTFTNNRSSLLQQSHHQTGSIVQNIELANMAHPLARSKRHIEIQLPQGMTYQTGDYLSILPANPPHNVKRVLRRCSLSPDTRIIIQKDGDARFHLPTGHPVSVQDIFTNYVELAQPATKRQLRTLAKACPCPPEKAEILQMAADDQYGERILTKRISILDILEKYMSIDLNLEVLLDMLPPLKSRQYSISSSPLANPQTASLTVAVVNAPAWSGQSVYRGVASNYLANLPIGSKIRVATQPSSQYFQLPADTTTPMILVCAGSGIAPFRGFIQERAIQKAQGLPLGEILLFFGCTHPQVDVLYQEALQRWVQEGVIQTYFAFSEQPVGDVKYVQHRLWQERGRVFQMFQNDGRVFVCGDGKRMAPAVKDAFVRICEEGFGFSAKKAKDWFTDLEREGTRYVVDVFV